MQDLNPNFWVTSQYKFLHMTTCVEICTEMWLNFWLFKKFIKPIYGINSILYWSLHEDYVEVSHVDQYNILRVEECVDWVLVYNENFYWILLVNKNDVIDIF